MQHTPYFDHRDINSIDLSDRTYRFSPLPETKPDDALMASIGQFGILHPPMLRQKGGNVIVASGRKRIMAARQLGLESVLCLLIPETVDDRFLYSLLIEEAVYGSRLSLIEQARLFDRFLQNMPPGEALPLLKKLGHKPQKYILEELLSLLSLCQSAVSAVHLGKISLKTALKMQRLSTENQEVVAHIITSLSLGGSKQGKLIDYCTELIMRTNIPLRQLLGKFIADDEPANRDDNIPQKTGALLLWLHNQCFPRSVEADNAFKKSVAALNLPENVHLGHSPSFEEETVTLSVRLSDLDTARQVLPEILKITTT